MTQPIYGQIKAGKGTLIGNAGEYFVVGELLRRGIVAALAPRNAPGFDVIAVEGDTSVNIRVKSKTDASAMWRWTAKKDRSIFRTITENDFTVLVDLKNPTQHVDYYILKTAALDIALKKDYQDWADAPGRGGRLRDPSNPVRGIGWWDEYGSMLDAAKGDWDLITGWLSREEKAHETIASLSRTTNEGTPQ